MYIHEAVTEAMAKGKRIARKNESRDQSYWPITALEPTNNVNGIIIWSTNSKRPPTPRWQPQAEDLMADDWVVVD